MALCVYDCQKLSQDIVVLVAAVSVLVRYL